MMQPPDPTPARRQGLRAALGAACLLAGGVLLAGASSAAGDDAFALDLLKTRFDQEIAFREAAIQVAWGAEALCDDSTEIEPFVLWSANAVRRRMGTGERALLQRATGMDEKWRVAWLDEGAPDELKLGDAVLAINGRPLPANTVRLDMGALIRGALPLTADDQAFWEVLLQARAEALESKPMTLTLEGGRRVTVETQAGCAGSVIASAFDDEPDVFWRQGNQRVKIPGNALLEARTRDEYRWLAAFGTYFQATERAIGRQEVADDVSKGFVVGQVLAFAVPGSSVLLGAAQAKTVRVITVDGLPSSADLFANEVVTALGGDPGAGLTLNRRLRDRGLAVDELMMSDFRRVNSEVHRERLLEFQAARARAEEQERLREAGQALPDEVVPASTAAVR